MYNGVGLSTPRGSGTSGHVMRNLSHVRPRDDYRSMSDRDMPVKHRAPDAAILDHERKRKIEVQCLELQDELEEKGLALEEVESQVDELRQKLSSQSRPGAPGQGAERGTIKEFQRHELLAAKAVDNARFERAFGIAKDYVEGESLNKEKEEERRQARIQEKERRDADLAERKRQYEADLERRKVEEAERDAKQRAERAQASEKHRLEVEARAKDRENHLRTIQQDRERNVGRSAPRARNNGVDSYRPPAGGRRGPSRSRSPSPRRAPKRARSDSRSLSRSRSRSRSRSVSSRSRSRSQSPPRRRDGGRRAATRSVSRSRSPARRTTYRQRDRSRSRSRSLDERDIRTASRRRADSRSVSPAGSPPRRNREVSPPTEHARSPKRRARDSSASGSEDMDVQSDRSD